MDSADEEDDGYEVVQGPASSGRTTGSESGVEKRKRGAPEDPLWTHVEPVPGNIDKVKCKHCALILNTCFASYRKMDGSEVKRRLRTLRSHFVCAEETSEQNRKKACNPSSPLPPFAFSTPNVTSGSAMNSDMRSHFVIPLSREDKQNFEEAFALYFYSTGMPFQRIESPDLLEALQILRPDVTLPDRHRLAGTLLDECYEKTKLRVAAAIKQSGWITVTSDSWTSVTGAAVMNFIAVTENGTFFENCIHTGSISHNTENIYAMLEESILKLGGFDKVAGVVTDNTTTNRAVWKKFKQLHRGFPVFISCRYNQRLFFVHLEHAFNQCIAIQSGGFTHGPSFHLVEEFVVTSSKQLCTNPF